MIAALLVLASQQAVPPPVVQWTANCTAPVYATDRLVCGDAELARADDAMISWLGRWRPPPVDGFAPWRESQEAWLKRRSLCAFRTSHRQCVVDAYAERMAVLRLVNATVERATDVAWRCGAMTGRWRGQAMLLIEPDGTPAGLAMRQASRSGWQPYLRLDGAGSKLRIVPLEGKPIRCVRDVR